MQMKKAPFLGRAGWLLHRMVASYWSLPLLGVLAALPVVYVLLYFDRQGLAQWLLDRRMNPVETADTAKDLVAVAVGINAAFITLYFSITLLVLTVASSNLGVRLVDRWLEKRLVRVSLAGLSFTLVFSLGAMAAMDGEAALADVPLATVGAVIFLQIVNVTMLTVALHDLGRTIFVDRAIHHLGRDASEGPVSVCAAKAFDGEWQDRIRSPREGYIEGNDLDGIASALKGHPGRVRICSAPEQHVLKGDTLVLLENAGADHDALLGNLAIGDFRSDGQGTVFRIRLLVEIAARALSPAVNDFYTALSAGDRIVAAMAGQRDSWIGDDCIPVWHEDERFELPGQDFRGLFEDPLAAFRQAACQYPSVSIRMIDNYARLANHARDDGAPDGFFDFIRDTARQLADHACQVTDFPHDRADIAQALERGFPSERSALGGTVE